MHARPPDALPIPHTKQLGRPTPSPYPTLSMLGNPTRFPYPTLSMLLRPTPLEGPSIAPVAAAPWWCARRPRCGRRLQCWRTALHPTARSPPARPPERPRRHLRAPCGTGQQRGIKVGTGQHGA
eukprot:352953-Chlamydomonas_euryale.AAC.6